MIYNGQIVSGNGNSIYVKAEPQGNTPFFNITDTVLSATEILQENIAINKPTNKLTFKDENGNDVECTFICNFIHPFNKIPSCLYYNPINGSYFITTNPDIVDPDIYKNMSKTISYFGVGVNNEDKSHGQSLIVNTDLITNLPAPATDGFESMKLRVCSFYGLMSKYVSNLRVDDGNGNAVYIKSNYSAVIEIPKNVIGTALHTHTIIPEGMTKFGIEYVGKTEPDNFYIILPY